MTIYEDERIEDQSTIITLRSKIKDELIDEGVAQYNEHMPDYRGSHAVLFNNITDKLEYLDDKALAIKTEKSTIHSNTEPVFEEGDLWWVTYGADIEGFIPNPPVDPYEDPIDNSIKNIPYFNFRLGNYKEPFNRHI